MGHRTWIVLGLALLALTPNPSVGQGKRDVPGLVWVFTATDGEEEIKGQFRVVDKVVYKAGDKVGVVKPVSGKETVLVVTGFPKLNGTARLKRVEANSAKWKGELKREDGSTLPISVEIRGME